MDHNSFHARTVLPAGWESAIDQASGHWYYYNRSTGATSWVPPQTDGHTPSVLQEQAAPALISAPAPYAHPATPAAATTVAEPPAVPVPAIASATTPSTTQPTPAAKSSGAARSLTAGQAQRDGNGWYYRDRGGVLYGPFQQEQLRAWRAYLPMDLLVWFVELQPLQQKSPKRQQQQRRGEESQDRDAAHAQKAAAEVRGHELQGKPLKQQQQHEGKEEARAAAEPDARHCDTADEEPDGEGSGGGGRETAGARRGGSMPLQNEAVAAGAAVGASPAPGLSGYGDGDVKAEDDDTGDDGAVRHRGRGGDARGDNSEPPTKRVRSEAASGDPLDGASAPQRISERLSASSSPSLSPSRGGAAGLPAFPEDILDGSINQPGGVGSANTAEEAIAYGLPGIELAELLGDGMLLADWRQRFPGARPAGTAPPASVHDHWLRAAAAAAATTHAYGATGQHQAHCWAHLGQTFSQVAGGADASSKNDGTAAFSRPHTREESLLEYAEAVLAGLPPDDEAVVLARQAAAAGKSLAEVVNFSWSASTSAPASSRHQRDAVLYDTEGSLVAPMQADDHGVPVEYVRDPRSGRLTAAGRDAASAPQSAARALYGEYGGWVNPDQIEEYLAKAKRWRQEQLPALWARRNLKEQREARAKKAARAAGL